MLLTALAKIGYLLTTPLAIAVIAIGFAPMLYGFYTSLTFFSTSNPEPKFVGLDNYRNLAIDPNFWNSIRITAIYVTGTVVFEFLMGLGLALLLFGKVKGRGVFESILLAPLAISPIVMGVLYSPNEFLDDINGRLFYGLNTGFFFDTRLPAVYYSSMILADAFIWAPLIMLVIVAILQSIPKEHFEAAEVNGASTFQTFRRITFPALVHSPVLATVLALRTVDSLRAYEIPFTWSFWLNQSSLGSPIDTFGVLMFKLFFSPGLPLPQIATIALVTMVFSFALAAIIMKFGARSWEGW